METVLSAHVTHKQARMSSLQRLGELNSLYLLHKVASIEGVRECAVLKTCNRVEVYVVTSDPEGGRKNLENIINGQVPYDAQENLVQYLSGLESVGHLIRVSCGLESMIIGEDQVQSQVKEAFEIAQAEGTMGPMLSTIFRKAISVGKKVRTETKVNKGCVSVGSAAVELAESKIGRLEGKNILVVGAGDMATLIAKHLVGKNPRTVFVSNRTYSRAVELAFVLGGRAVRFDALVEFLSEADVVLCATSATHMILTERHLVQAMAQRQGERMVIIDVSFPRNVEPQVAEVEGVELYDLDGLRDVAEENILRRKDEIKSAERIISQELSSFENRMREMRADEVLSRLYSKFNSLKEKELHKAANRLAASDEPPEKVLADFANSLTNRFLADPTESLKQALRQGDLEMLEIMEELFKIEGGPHVPGKPTS